MAWQRKRKGHGYEIERSGSAKTLNQASHISQSEMPLIETGSDYWKKAPNSQFQKACNLSHFPL